MYIFERLINWLDAHSCVNIGSRKIKVIIWGKFRQNEDEFYAEKTKYQAETETLKKQAQETQQKMQDMLLDNALKVRIQVKKTSVAASGKINKWKSQQPPDRKKKPKSSSWAKLNW